MRAVRVTPLLGKMRYAPVSRWGNAEVYRLQCVHSDLGFSATDPTSPVEPPEFVSPLNALQVNFIRRLYRQTPGSTLEVVSAPQILREGQRSSFTIIDGVITVLTGEADSAQSARAEFPPSGITRYGFALEVVPTIDHESQSVQIETAVAMARLLDLMAPGDGGLPKNRMTMHRKTTVLRMAETLRVPRNGGLAIHEPGVRISDIARWRHGETSCCEMPVSSSTGFNVHVDDGEFESLLFLLHIEIVEFDSHP